MRCVAKVDVEANGVVGQDNKWLYSSFVTEINGTIEEVKNYYKIGKTINMGLWYDGRWKEHEDDLMHITNVFVLEDCSETTDFVESLGRMYGWDWEDHFCQEEYDYYLEKKNKEPENII